MKGKKILGVLLSLLLIAGMIPFAAAPASAASGFTIVGWENEGPEGAIASVKVNGIDLPENGGTIIAAPDETVSLEITMNDGFALGYWLDGVRIRFAGVQSGTKNICSTTGSSSIKLPSSDWLENEDQELYLIISTEEVETVDIQVTVGPVVCGDTYGSDTECPLSIPDSEDYSLNWGGWLVEAPEGLLGFDMPKEDGIYKGGDTAFIGMHINLMNVNAEVTESDVTVNGGTIHTFERNVFNNGMVTIVVAINVEHVPGETVIENETEADCETPGSHDEVVYCEKCKEEISRETVTEDALGHEWSEWTVTKEATETEEGEESRLCARCLKTETRPIPKLEPEEPEEPEETETFSLTFDLGGGTLNGETGPLVIKAEKGSEITIPDAPTKEGFKFLYWKGSEYHPGDKYKVTEDHAFTAEWEQIKEETSPNVPKTGDESQPVLWLTLLAAAGVGLLMLRKRSAGNRT